jgi:transposase
LHKYIVGYNPGIKQEINIGKCNNQNFVQIPFHSLRAKLKALCERYGLIYTEQEESYTSQASFVDADTRPTIGEKPEGWQASGKRTKRGLYRTANNQYINADANAAANILRKVSMTLGFDLSGVSRGALTHPTRIRFWVTAQKKSGATWIKARCVASIGNPPSFMRGSSQIDGYVQS